MSLQITANEANTFKNKEQFKISQNNLDIKITISFNDKILSFDLEEETIFPKKEYHRTLTLNEFVKIDKIFKIFDSLEEIFNFFKKLINDKKISVIKDSEKELKIKIHNSLFDNYFSFDIPIKKADINSEINSMIQYSISLNNKINELEKKVIENQKEINELKKSNQKHENEFKEFKEKITKEIYTKEVQFYMQLIK